MDKRKQKLYIEIDSRVYDRIRTYAVRRGKTITKYAVMALIRQMEDDDIASMFVGDYMAATDRTQEKRSAEDYADFVAKVEMKKKREEDVKRDRVMYSDWKETDNEIALMLRDAYLNGVRIVDISKVTGVNRTSLYFYLSGERTCPDKYAESIREAVTELLKS